MTTNKINIKRISDPCDLLEAPHWDHQKKRLLYVDIYENKIYSYYPETGKRYSAYIKNGPVSVIIPVEGEPDKFVLGSGHDFLLVTWNGESNVADLPFEKLASVEGDRTDTRFNDGKVDTSGRVWIGTMALEKSDGSRDPDRGALYSIDTNLRPIVQASPVTLSNGIEWSLENVIMYYIDSPTSKIWAFDFDVDNGVIKNKRAVFDFEQNVKVGSPDGMTIDTNGNLWVALFFGSKLLNIDPKEGKVIRSIEMPAINVTSMAFGGTNLDILYVTTAYHALKEDDKKAKPESGCLFAIEGLGVRGRLPNNFKMQK